LRRRARTRIAKHKTSASPASQDGAEQVAASGQTNGNNAGNMEPPSESLLLPQPTGFVNDFANVMDLKTKQRLEEKLDRLKQQSQIEFALVTVETTGTEKIEDYSLELVRSWGVGSNVRGGTGGLLLMLAVKDRKWRMQVSKSLEADLPDDYVSGLGGLMTGPFRAGNYGEGLTKCVDAVIERLGQQRGFKPDE
jgi:uncharacterized protein